MTNGELNIQSSSRFANRLFHPFAALVIFAIALPSYGDRAFAERVVEGARGEVRKGTIYHSDYVRIAYPNGDVPSTTGVCTDLIVRAFRDAGIDLQQLVHEDRVKHPEDYPTYLWANKKPDRNIDHRRCQNLVVFFRKYAKALTTEFDAEYFKEWQPGDVVFFVREGQKHPWHVAIISDRKSESGEPLILHLFPPRASEASLGDYMPVHSHYRWK